MKHSWLLTPIVAAAAFSQPVPPVPPAAPTPPAFTYTPLPPLPPLAPLPPMPDFAFDTPLPPLPPLAPLPPMPDFAFDMAFAWPKGFAFQTRGSSDREYQRGMRAIDKQAWDEAAESFSRAGSEGSRADAALYWKAYALGRAGKNTEALAALNALAQAHPQSAWTADANALKAALNQAGGQPIGGDEELKITAVDALMRSDPERAIPLLEKLLQSPSSPKLRHRVLSALVRSDSPKAREIVARVAKGSSNPDLQLLAVQHLGSHDGKENRQLLADIYASSKDEQVKRRVIRGWMAMGEHNELMKVAKSETSPELRREAIHMLGTMRSPGITAELVSMYGSTTDAAVRGTILRALMVQGDAKPLIEVARKETDPELKKAALQHLANMRSSEATAFLMEIIEK